MDLSPGPEIWRYPHIAGRGEGDRQDRRSQDTRHGIRSQDMRQGIRSQDMQVLSRESGQLGRSAAENKVISGRAVDISGRAADNASDDADKKHSRDSEATSSKYECSKVDDGG